MSKDICEGSGLRAEWLGVTSDPCEPGGARAAAVESGLDSGARGSAVRGFGVELPDQLDGGHVVESVLACGGCLETFGLPGFSGRGLARVCRELAQ